MPFFLLWQGMLSYTFFFPENDMIKHNIEMYSKQYHTLQKIKK